MRKTLMQKLTGGWEKLPPKAGCPREDGFAGQLTAFGYQKEGASRHRPVATNNVTQGKP